MNDKDRLLASAGMESCFPLMQKQKGHASWLLAVVSVVYLNASFWPRCISFFAASFLCQFGVVLCPPLTLAASVNMSKTKHGKMFVHLHLVIFSKIFVAPFKWKKKNWIQMRLVMALAYHCSFVGFDCLYCPHL